MSRAEHAVYHSPCGSMELTVRDGMLAGVRLLRRRPRAGRAARPSGAMARAFAALDAYFAGDRTALDAVPVDTGARSGFGARVLAQLRRVPFGQVITYAGLAARAGSARGARAAGGAVGANPLPLFVPCHRVVASGGGLGGFGAGLPWKRRLLEHEGWTVTEGGIVAKHAEDREAARAGRGAAPEKVCVYAGSFDPPTNGHMYMVERGAELFDRLIVAVGVNAAKHCTFSVPERVEMLRLCTRGMRNVEVDSFENQFLVHYARAKGAGYVLRGVRSEEDYRFEHAMRNVNEDLEPEVCTVFLIPPREICEVSSSFVKGLVGIDGWREVVRPYVPQPVYDRLLGADIRWADQSAGAEGAAD